MYKDSLCVCVCTCMRAHMFVRTYVRTYDISLELATMGLISYALCCCATVIFPRAASCQQGAPHPDSLFTHPPNSLCLLTHFFCLPTVTRGGR